MDRERCVVKRREEEMKEDVGTFRRDGWKLSMNRGYGFPACIKFHEPLAYSKTVKPGRVWKSVFQGAT